MKFPIEDAEEDESYEIQMVTEEAAKLLVGVVTYTGVYTSGGGPFAMPQVELTPRRKTPTILSVTKQEFLTRVARLKELVEKLEAYGK